MNPTEFHNTRKFAAPAFGRIAYIEKGVDPTTLCLHGLPRGGYEWRNVIGIWHRDEEVLPSTIPTQVIWGEADPSLLSNPPSGTITNYLEKGNGNAVVKQTSRVSLYRSCDVEYSRDWTGSRCR